jgi:hypothetical protein
MENNLIALVNGETVELKGKALDELLAGQKSANAKLEADKAEAQVKAQAKAALLERLGLTQEEFNILTAQS